MAKTTVSGHKKISLNQQLAQREAELALINSVQAALASKLDIQAIYDLVGDKIRDIFDAQVVTINSFDIQKQLSTLHYGIEKGSRFYDTPYPLMEGHLRFIRERQPLLINSDWERRMRDFGYTINIPAGTEMPKSSLFVPLLSNNEVKGSVSLQNVDSENVFDDSDVRLLQTLANSMSVALENARLFDETQRLLKETEQRAAELQIINSVQQGMASKLDMQAIYDLVGNKIRDVFHNADAGIRIYDVQTNMVHTPYAYRGGERETIELFPVDVQDTGFTAHVFRTRQPLLINQNYLQEAEKYGSTYPPGSRDVALKSILFVPLVVEEYVRGLIYLTDTQRENAFSESDVRLLQTLANSMSIALENARLFEETQRLLKETEQRAAELQIINSVQQGLASKLEIQAIYDLVGDKIRDIFDAQVVLIGTLDPASQTEEFKYNIEKGQRYYPASRRFDEVRRQLVETRLPYLNNRITLDEIIRTGGSVVKGTETPKSILFVPLTVGQQVTGYVSLQNVDHHDAFAESDVRLLQTLANSMSVAIENARLFDETQRLLKETKQRAGELSAISTVSQALVAETELNSMIQLIGSQMRDIFNADIAYVALLDPQSSLIHFPYQVGEAFTELNLGKGLTSRIIQSGEPLLINRNVEERSREIGVARIGKEALSYSRRTD